MIGPNCQFLTPLHPLDPDERNSGLEYGAPITMGIISGQEGGGAILPGVTLGRQCGCWRRSSGHSLLETMWSLQEIQPVSLKKYPSKRRRNDP